MSNAKKCPNQQVRARKDLLAESNPNKIKVMRLRIRLKTAERKNEVLCQESGTLPSVNVGTNPFTKYYKQ